MLPAAATAALSAAVDPASAGAPASVLDPPPHAEATSARSANNAAEERAANLMVITVPMPPWLWVSGLWQWLRDGLSVKIVRPLEWPTADGVEWGMALRINDIAPDFSATTTEGTIQFHDWIGDGYALLFSHPKDFTPVCTTELGYMAGLKPEFDKRNTKIVGLSVDPVGNHAKWAKDIEETQGHAVTYPMIGDPELKVAKAYDMLPEAEGDSAEGRTAADNATVRSVFVIGPDKKIKAMLTYPMSTGRNFDEVLRLLDSCQLTAKHQVATPVNWKNGEDCIIVPAVSDEAAKAKYPNGWKAPKPYLRIVPQPK